MLKIVDIVCPQKKPAFSQVSLSKMTMSHRGEGNSDDLNVKLQDITKSVTYSNIMDPTRVFIFICQARGDFQTHEELLLFESLKYWMRVVECLIVCCVFEASIVKCEFLIGVTIVHAVSMVGAKTRAMALLNLSNYWRADCEHVIIITTALSTKKSCVAQSLRMAHFMSVVMKFVDFTKSRRLSQRKLKVFLEDYEDEFGNIVSLTAAKC